MPGGDSSQYGPVVSEVRPSGEKMLKDWVVPLGFSLVLSPFAIKWRDPDAETRVIAVVVAVGFVLMTLFMVFVWLRKSRCVVRVTPTHVVRTRMTGQDAAARAALTEAVLAQRCKSPGVRSPILFLTDSSTSTRMQLGAPMWAEEDLRGIGQAAQHFTVVPILSAEEGRTRWPRMMPWSCRHPYVAIAVSLAGTLLVLAISTFFYRGPDPDVTAWALEDAW